MLTVLLSWAGSYMQKGADQGAMLQLQAKSHVEINEFSQRAAIEAAQKLRRLQQERNPGGDEYWPYVFPPSSSKLLTYPGIYRIFVVNSTITLLCGASSLAVIPLA